MAALPVGVVGDEIEEADALELGVVLGILAQGEVVLLEVSRNEELERALTVGTVALDRERHEPPAERLGEMPRRELALVEPAREVPQRPLAALRLVHGESRRARARQLDEKRGVGAPRHPTLQGDLASGQNIQRLSGRRDRCSACRCARWDPWAGCTRGRSGG